MVKSTDCCSKAPEFKPKKPHGGSQLSIMRSGASSGVSEENDSYIYLNLGATKKYLV